MFNKEKNPASEKQSSGGATLISAGTTLNGDIISDNDLRVDGTIKGNIKCSSKIIIGPTGFVDGHIESVNADITGKVQGNVVVKEFLQLRGESKVIGNLTAVKLQVDPTATFNGQCHMGTVAASNNTKASIVQMTSDVPAAAEAK